MTKAQDLYRKTAPTEPLARLTLTGSALIKQRLPAGVFGNILFLLSMGFQFFCQLVLSFISIQLFLVWVLLPVGWNDGWCVAMITWAGAKLGVLVS